MTTNKITLITPPDIYENSNFSILFLGLTEEQQTSASVWMGQNDNFPPCNFYYYEGENNLPWLLFALNRANATFMNLDSEHAITSIMGSYILGKPGVFYTTKDQNLKSLISYINGNYVEHVDVFLEKVFNEQRK